MWKLVPTIALLLTLAQSSFAQIKVLMSGGFAAAYQELLPAFEQSTGIKVTTTRGASQGDGPTTIGGQLRQGAAADMVIMSKEGLSDLMAEGKIVANSEVDLAMVPLGVGVRAGAARPDITTVDAFKRAVLGAKSIGIQSSSAIFLTSKVFPKLGLSGAVAGKTSNAGAVNVASGEVEMVILPVSEIRPYQGVDFVGTIPDELQFVQVFAAALVKGGKDAENCKRLIAFLASEKSTPAIEKTGMKRPGR